MGAEPELYRAHRMLARFLEGKRGATQLDLILALRPRDEDYPSVFLDAIADRVQAAYAPFWDALEPWPISPEQTLIKVAVATAHDFVEGSAAADEFPGGYRDIAAFLRPGRPWICWQFVKPGESEGLLFDGLVAIGERWAWFPKPFRVLPGSRPNPLEYWAE